MAGNPIVIAGAGLAGATAAEALRNCGFSGEIVLAGAEDHHPYIRPPLSKDYLAGREDAQSALVYPPDWYAEHGVRLLRGTTVESVDPGARTLALSDASTLRYSQLLLATGASPRRLELPGTGLDGVHYLRTLGDSESLHTALASGNRRLVVIGMGWIGMEVAATARQLGNDVTVVGRGEVPLATALGETIGNIFADTHRREGVQLRTGRWPVEILGEDGKVAGVQLDDGERLPADLVLAAIGAVPNTALAEAAGLAVSNGIDTDQMLRTSAEHVFAAGDVARAFHPGYGAPLRSEHWANAIAQGKTAAAAMLGQDSAHDDIPYFYTDQFGIGMEYSGYFPWAAESEPVFRGSYQDLDKLAFIAFWLRGGKVVAGMNVNTWDIQEPIQDLIRSGRSVDAADLTNPDKELTSL